MSSAVAYIRVSSRAQDDATQRNAIERAARARGDTIEGWYAEKRSAKTMARAELQRLLVAARAGELQGVRLYLFRLDRLTRTGIADTLTTLDLLRGHGVDVVSVADGFDLNGPQAEVIVSVMAWAAKMERLAAGERIAAARERIEAQGGRWGRPSRVDRATRARAVELHAAGKSVRDIARALKVPRSTIARAIAMSQNGPRLRGRRSPEKSGPQ
ncbi:MAG: recombinase family protein [Polyangiaceae bacterium]